MKAGPALAGLREPGRLPKKWQSLRDPHPRLLEFLHPLSATLHSEEGCSAAERGQGVR